ncbi:cyclophane-containing peptide 2OG-Fe(II) oxygenase YhhC [Stenotrophomonas sp.]|uniref:cyclophane-containing peptide 2OG-Fe(II) oxygenase YhhC n=1 Tax=Stenotrophomonas sp. TaxID=69392 RepID=UPI0031D12CCA
MKGFLESANALDRHPFDHCSVPCALGEAESEVVLSWLETSAPWRLKVASFYEQYEFSLLDCELPPAIDALLGRLIVDAVRSKVEAVFGTQLGDQCDVTAHKLVRGQRIRIHNDYIPGQETHRVLVQLNRGWVDENGGILMLFSSGDAADLAKAFRPQHDTGFAFAIGPTSHHAVTPIVSGDRYTLVFSFYARNS